MDGLSTCGLCLGIPIGVAILILLIKHFGGRTPPSPTELATAAESVREREIRKKEQEKQSREKEAERRSESEIASWPSRRSKVLKLIYKYIRDEANRGKKIVYYSVVPTREHEKYDKPVLMYPFYLLSFTPIASDFLSTNGENELADIIQQLESDGYQVATGVRSGPGNKHKTVTITW